MASEFLLPDPGEGIHEADILEIHVSPGDEVKDGDPLFSVETDKAIVDIPSSFDGTIEEIRVEVGDIVEVGSVLLTYSGTGEETDTGTGEETDTGGGEETEPASEPDVSPGETGEPSPGDDGGRPKKPPVPASPATRSLAKRLGVDLQEIKGSGPEGRIEPQDVQAAAGETDEEEPSQPEREKERESVAAHEAEDVEWVELRGVRRASAAQMSRSWSEIPHVSHHDIADITELEELRGEHRAEIESNEGSLSLTVFLMKAVAVALEEHPRFNAILDSENDRVGLKDQVNIGVAVDTEDGLVVAVIRDVGDKSIVDLAMELPEMAGRMRSRDRSLEDMQGGTFTLTNPGAIGGTSFNPIINHPEVAILGAAQAREVPVFADNGSLDAKLQLPLVLAFDHRVNDGADAARFMNTIKAYLEDPAELMLRA